MPYRFYDWECTGCENQHSPLVWVDHGAEVPETERIDCPVCMAKTKHERRISRPAYYTYDLPYAPAVHGGSFDTMGYRKPPPIPELPNDASMAQAREFQAATIFTCRQTVAHGRPG